MSKPKTCIRCGRQGFKNFKLRVREGYACIDCSHPEGGNRGGMRSSEQDGAAIAAASAAFYAKLAELTANDEN